MADHRSRLKKVGLLVLLWLVMAVPKLIDLDLFVAVDEVNWLHRSANFYSALMHGDFAGTFVNRTPGVITTWIEAAAFRLEVPYYVVTQDIQRTSYYMFELTLTELGIKPLDILHTARVFMVFFMSSVLVGCFNYLSRLFGRRAALAGILLLAFDPLMTALTRTSHLDAPQAVLMLLSLLSLSSYLFVQPRWPDLILSGATGGMAVLAKLPGVFIIPAAGLLLMIAIGRKSPRPKKLSDPAVKEFFYAAAVWGISFIVAFFLLWPSMWTAPGETIAEFFGQAVRYSSTASQTVGLNEISPPSSRPGVEILNLIEPDYSPAYFFRYLVHFLWRTTPIVLFGLMLFIYYSIRKSPQTQAWKPSLIGIWIMILIYTVGMTLPWKSSDKYYAPVFMLACLVAGLGWCLAANSLAERIGNKRGATWLLVAVLAVQLGFSLSHHPYYFSYYNPLLGGGQRASQKTIVGVGEGLDIAAQILDDIPGSEELRVMSWYGIGPFSYYFDGQVEPMYDTTEDVWNIDFIQKLQSMDYVVIYTNQKLRGGPNRLFELINATNPRNTVVINGIEYAWIYRVRDLPFENEIDRLQVSPVGEQFGN